MSKRSLTYCFSHEHEQIHQQCNMLTLKTYNNSNIQKITAQKQSYNKSKIANFEKHKLEKKSSTAAKWKIKQIQSSKLYKEEKNINFKNKTSQNQT